MKKLLKITLAFALAASVFAGCSSSTETAGTAESTETTTTESTESTDEPAAEEETTGSAAMEGPITVVSREDGSGTRGAFVELMGIEQEDENGETMDMTTLDAVITNSTSVMMTTVSGDKNAIGYISLGSLNDTVKAVAVDGAEPTVENIEAGNYAVSRPFNIVTKADTPLSDAAQDFVDFILSTEGQEVVAGEGYIHLSDTEAFAGGDVSGDVVVAGSSSVTPVMEKLAEAYEAINANVDVAVQQSDSNTGVTSALEGSCDIGMASRAIKDSEIESGAVGTTIATDGIAIIVNNDNPTTDLSSDVVKDIFMGNVTDWADVK